jgi:hypothetical protein
MCKRVAGSEMCPRKIIFLIMSAKSDTLCAGSDPATLGISIMFTMTKLLKRSALLPATAFASALMLAACGSGGGSSSSDTPVVNTATPDGYWSGAVVKSSTEANTLGGLILKDKRFWLIESSRISSTGSSTIFGVFTGTMNSSYNSQTRKNEFSTASSTYFQNPIGSSGVVANPVRADFPLRGEFVAASSLTGFVYNATTPIAGISLPQYDATLYNTAPSLSKIQGDWTANKNSTPAIFFAINNGSFASAQVLPNCFANGAFSVVSGANAYGVTLSFPAGCAVINQAPGAAYSGIALTESGSSRLTLALVRTDQNQALFLLFDR